MFILSSQTPQVREYQIKALFLFNFTQFVEWPSDAFSEPNAPLVIGILGADPFGPYLDETIANEEANGHPLIIDRYRNMEEVKTCHILFINSQEINKVALNESLKERSILTVSDAPNFIQEGGMIRFFIKSNKIQFQINPNAAKMAGLNISSKLLRLAEIVIPKGKKQ